MSDQLTQWRRILARSGFKLGGPPDEQERVLQELIDMYEEFRADGHRHMDAVHMVLILADVAVRQNAKREESAAGATADSLQG